jgi:hypothetical protein
MARNGSFYMTGGKPWIVAHRVEGLALPAASPGLLPKLLLSSLKDDMMPLKAAMAVGGESRLISW